MKAPKMLPWLARKAGISDTHAEALWAEAIVFATVHTEWVGTSDYWKAAVDRLVELVELESQPLRTITTERESVRHSACRPAAVTGAQNQKIAA